MESGDYGRGYRSGKEIERLEQENAELQAIVRALQIKIDVAREVDNMSDAELEEALRPYYRDEPEQPSAANRKIVPRATRQH